MRRAHFILIVLVTGLAACGGNVATNRGAESAVRACTPPRTYWLPPGPLGSGLVMNHLSIDHRGAIYWNGQPASLSRVSYYLTIVDGMSPEPLTFLETEMGAPCALVDRVRDEMDRRLHCRASYRCGEGIWKVWQETPLPPGTPPT
jgi:hypothetical protein